MELTTYDQGISRLPSCVEFLSIHRVLRTLARSTRVIINSDMPMFFMNFLNVERVVCRVNRYMHGGTPRSNMYIAPVNEKNPEASDMRVLNTLPIIVSVISTSYVLMKYRHVASAMRLSAMTILPAVRPSHSSR